MRINLSVDGIKTPLKSLRAISRRGAGVSPPQTYSPEAQFRANESLVKSDGVLWLALQSGSGAHLGKPGSRAAGDNYTQLLQRGKPGVSKAMFEKTLAKQIESIGERLASEGYVNEPLRFEKKMREMAESLFNGEGEES